MDAFAVLPPVFGNLHLLLLHLPVGLMVAAALMELWTWRDAAARRLTGKILAANVWFAVLAAAAGLLLAEQGGYAEAPLARHRWAGIVCAVTAAAAWWLHARKGKLAGRIGLAALVVATTVAGHYGAVLTHGDGLLAWSKPGKISPRAVADPVPGSDYAAAAAGDTAPAALVEPGKLHPLVELHCVECHGAEKQKGRLRLDSLSEAFKAGRSGDAAVTPGDPGASELMRRILLPADDEEIMPPVEDGRAPLTVAEKEELRRWIASLAGRPATVAAE